MVEKLRRLTVYADPDEIVDNSRWGVRVEYVRWCALLVDELKTAGLPAVIRSNGGGRIAVFLPRNGRHF